MTDTSKPKFTPGPWRSFESGSDGARVLPDTGNPREDMKYIARVDGRDVLTDFANARLIAAAPELYSAAKLLAAAEDIHANCPECQRAGAPEYCESCFWHFDNARLARRAALAKAEGEAPDRTTDDAIKRQKEHTRLFKEPLTLRGKATDHIWVMGDIPGYIGVRLDCGDCGAFYLTPAQAGDLAFQLRDYLDEVKA